MSSGHLKSTLVYCGLVIQNCLNVSFILGTAIDFYSNVNVS